MKRILKWLVLALLLAAASGCGLRATPPPETANVQAEVATDPPVATDSPEPTATALLPTNTPAREPTATPQAPTATQRAATASPRETATPEPFSGAFEGTVHADRNSSAPIELVTLQRGNSVTGLVSIGNGLEVSAGGFCGTLPVPATTFGAAGDLDDGERELTAESVISVSGFDVGIDLTATLSEDGETIIAEAELDTPSLCSRDPVLRAELERTE